MDQAVVDYIEAIPAQDRALFDRVHRLILDACPDAVVRLSYGMPTYKLGKYRLHVGSWKHGASIYGWKGRGDGGFTPAIPSFRQLRTGSPQADGDRAGSYRCDRPSNSTDAVCATSRTRSGRSPRPLITDAWAAERYTAPTCGTAGDPRQTFAAHRRHAAGCAAHSMPGPLAHIATPLSGYTKTIWAVRSLRAPLCALPTPQRPNHGAHRRMRTLRRRRPDPDSGQRSQHHVARYRRVVSVQFPPRTPVIMLQPALLGWGVRSRGAKCAGHGRGGHVPHVWAI